MFRREPAPLINPILKDHNPRWAALPTVAIVSPILTSSCFATRLASG
jgi:hypothetical protein